MSIIDPPMVTKLMLVPEANVFPGAQPGSALVLHKTASGTSAEAIANFFINDPNKASTHFVIGQDGEIVQTVRLQDGAGGNCCVEAGHDPYWDPLVQHFGNLNVCTISIEHCDPTPDNSTPLTNAQKASSFRLIKWLVDQYGFDITPDGKGQMVDIKGHDSIDPINRARCPGNYPWPELITYLQGATPVQTYSAQSSDFPHWFTQQDANHWLCKQTGCVVQFGIKSFYAQLSLDGQTLPVIGLPKTNETPLTINGKQVTLQVFERGALAWDVNHVKDSEPGTKDVYLVKLDDPDLLKLIPGLQLPTVTVLPDAVKKDAQAVLAAVQQLAKDAGIA